MAEVARSKGGDRPYAPSSSYYPERLSPVGTFFLGPFYLQYKVNRLGRADPHELEFTLR